ncbi:MAG: acyl-CoA desaturase [Gemmataceae bacterium]
MAGEPLVIPFAQAPAAVREGGGHRSMIVVYLGLHLALLGLFWTGLTLVELLAAFLLVELRGLALSAGYHRLLAHRAFRTYRWVRFLLAATACTALRGGPLWWVAYHRYHHQNADTDADVFTAEKGFWWSYYQWLVSGYYVHTDYDRVRDLRDQVELRWLNRWWLVPSLLLAASIILLGGPRAFFTVYVLSTVVLLHSLAWVDVLNHGHGWQRYDTGDESRNSWLLALLTNGEGWHNNHHHYPASATLGFRWWEVDSTFTLLWLASMGGVVWNLKRPPEKILQLRLKNASVLAAARQPESNASSNKGNPVESEWANQTQP